MKKTLKFTAAMLLSGIIYAQPDVRYTYDDAGNRVKRETYDPNLPDMLVSNNNEMHEHLNKSKAILVSAQPNPTPEKVLVAIEYKEIEPQPVNMYLFDVTGKKIAQAKNIKQSQHEFNLQALPKGIYYIKITTLNGQQLEETKVVKE